MSISSHLEQLFRGCFYQHHRTRLQGGASEPLYTPATPGRDACIYYREDFPASALHEVSHWCVAGAARRQQEDYGYWYAPDGRDAGQQREFERVEIVPQAIEWHFALACGLPFRVSMDNLSLQPSRDQDFALAVRAQARRYCDDGLPPRAALFRQALAQRFGASALPQTSDFEHPAP